MEEHKMKNSALVVIDLQNDITKNYKEIIEKVNEAIDWAVEKGLRVVYIQHNNLSSRPKICADRRVWPVSIINTLLNRMFSI